MPTNLNHFIDPGNAQDVTHMLEKRPILLNVSENDVVDAQQDYTRVISEKTRTFNYGGAMVAGFYGTDGTAILGEDFDRYPGLILGPSEAANIRRIAASVPGGVLEPPRPIYIQAHVLNSADFQDHDTFESSVEDVGNILRLQVERMYLLPVATKSSLQSGDNLLQKVARTMFGLTEEQRIQIRTLKIEEIVLGTSGMELLAIPVIRAAISSVTLTGLNPTEWVDPKVIRIQQDAGNLAAANFILKYLEG